MRLRTLLVVGPLVACPGAACDRPLEPTRGLGEICVAAGECLAGRACVEIVAGRDRVCGQTCRSDAPCVSRAHPDAWCRTDATGAGVCVIPCVADADCPGDLVCGAAGHCVPPGREWARVAGPISPPAARVDIVVLVDNSATMAEEQAALAEQFPALLAQLVQPPDGDRDTVPDYPPVDDLNIGVVSSDMGAAGYGVPTCDGGARGDAGCFRHDAPDGRDDCERTFPSFLSRNPGNLASYAPWQLAHDFGCIAELGTRGCGFEQPLAALEAALGEQQAPGACNAGFLRPDSVLVLLVVTDEDDCSVDPAHPEMFDPDRSDLGHLNLRCFLHQELVLPVERFDAAFRALRADAPDRLIVGFVAGVPPDAGACQGSGETLDRCLSDPQMQERIDPGNPVQLLPSCDTRHGRAYPPRRLVRLAQTLGTNVFVASICDFDWSFGLEILGSRIVARLGGGCFGVDLPFDVTTCRAACRVVEHLADDRGCPADPGCACDFSGCRDTAGRACEPLHRDVGVVVEGGRTRRVCRLRQADRTPRDGGCGDPREPGWIFVHRMHSPLDCPQLVLRWDGEPLLPEGATAYVECGAAP